MPGCLSTIWKCHFMARIAVLVFCATFWESAQASDQMTLTPITRQPEDCKSLLASRSNASTLYDWRDTLELEHCDRIKRLWHLSVRELSGNPPTFFDTRIPAYVLPPGLRANIPVLRVVFEDRVFFDTGLSDLRADAQQVISVVSDNLRKEPADITIFVAGHTDSVGGRPYNQRLSEARAAAVAAALTQRPSNVAHIWHIGFGKDFPLAPNDSDAHRALNRRVEFLIAGREEAIVYYLQQLQDLVCADVLPPERNACWEKERISLDRRTYRARRAGPYIAAGTSPAPPSTIPTPSSFKEVKPQNPVSTVDFPDSGEVIIVPRWDHVELEGLHPRGTPQKVDP